MRLTDLPTNLLSVLRHLGRRGRLTLGALVLATIGACAFAKLASEIFEGETRPFDDRLLLLLRNPRDRADPLGPHWIEEAARDVTALGSTTVLSLLTAFVAGFLLLERKRHAAIMASLAAGGAGVLSTLLKLGYNRPRPSIVPHLGHVSSASYPSGHSMVSTAVLLSLAAMLAQTTPRTATRIYLFAAAALASLGIGSSRVYLGVHYPTDVLGGWVAGVAWALCWWVAWRCMQRQASHQALRESDAMPRSRAPQEDDRRAL